MSIKTKVLCNGYEEIPLSHDSVDIINPARGEVVGRAFKAQEGDEVRILSAAREGFKTWSSVPLHERARILRNYCALLDEHHEELNILQCREMGKIITECDLELSDSTAASIGFIERACHLYGQTLCDNHPGLEQDLIFTKREPIGVFFCIVPFNFPVELFTHKVIPALVMGNSVIVKLPSSNPLVLTEMTRLLVQAGVPKNAVSLVYCDRSFSTEKIIKSREIDAVTLTGSCTAGISVIQNSAELLHKVFLELGGNDPLIVFADADMDVVVEEIFAGRIFNSGQTCCASKRFIVEESCHDKLVEKLITRLRKLRPGDPIDEDTELGSLINRDSAKEVLNQIAHTVKQGARLVYGGQLLSETVVEPAILVDVTGDMDIAGSMEVFGPVIPILTFRTADEALTLANQIPYGLQGGIMTSDMTLALNLASKLQCGSVVVNGSGNYRHMDMPFGGYKMTGIGREGVSATLEEFSQQKSYIVKGVF